MNSTDLNAMMSSPYAAQHHAHRTVTVPALGRWAGGRVLYPASCQPDSLNEILGQLNAAGIAHVVLSRGAMPVGVYASQAFPSDAPLATRGQAMAAQDLILSLVEACETGSTVRFYGEWGA